MTNAMKIAICDDDGKQMQELDRIVHSWSVDVSQKVEIRTYPSGEAFLFDYEAEPDFDLLLLDIEMPGIDGISLAKKIRASGNRVEIIFLTSHTEFYGEGYEVDALHFLIKPVKEEKLRAVLTKAVEQLVLEPPFLIVRCNGETVKLYESEIWYIEAFLHYIVIYTGMKEIRIMEKISEMEIRLTHDFYRCHRSYLVSLKHVKKIARNEVTLENGTILPLARGKYDDINRAYIDCY